jgi:predicted type IV restriction endonuclease
MRIKSPLANFTEILGQIRDSAELYYETLRVNESSTRAVLIDPILRVLGWDTSNPFMVEVEKSIDQGRVDYALFDVNQEIQVIIEAKKLDSNINDKEIFLSLVRYAFSSGVSDIFLTDGLHWNHYTDFKPGQQEPTKSLSLKDDNLVEIAAYLVQRLDAAKYWPEDKDVDELSQQINQLDSEINTLRLELAKLKIEKGEGSQQSKEKTKLTQDKIQDTEKFIELKSIGNATRTKPSALKLPNGTVVTVKTWTDVLSQCCQFAMEHNTAIRLPLKDAAGKKVKLISEARPPKGITYYETEYQGKQVFIYTNYDSNNCIRNSLHVLNETPSAEWETEPSVIYN